MKNKIIFTLPPKGIFTRNNIDDPLDFYYRPIVGSIYKARIQNGLSLLNNENFDSILEFGYGSGLLLPTLASISKTLHAIDTESDIEKARISINKLKLQVELKKENIFSANYQSNSFDLIAAFSVFEHISDPEAILAEMERILKPGGKLLVGMPRVDIIMTQFFNTIGFRNIGNHHVKNHKAFIQDASRHFKVLKTSHIPKYLPSFAGLYFNMLFVKQ